MRTATNTAGLTAACASGRLVTERIVTLSELAVYIGIPRRRLYRLIAKHRGVPVFKSGRHWCADIDEFREWLLAGFDQEQAELMRQDKRRGPRRRSRNNGTQLRDPGT